HRHWFTGHSRYLGTGGTTMNTSPYSFRASFATVLLKVAGREVTAGAMAHRASSTTVCENYNDGNRRLDFFGIATGEGQVANLQETRNIAVYAAPVNVPKLDIDGLVERVPMIAILLKQANNLSSWLSRGGEEAWEEKDWKDLLVRSRHLL
ncbi:hypothetical protein DFH06DRAFT_950634, partial [Mycena polygramma]